MKKRITSLLLALSLVLPAFAASPALLSECFSSKDLSTPKRLN